ncbi:MAG: DUF2157 domain-containing protein [Egibacteraceae bacterium]
MIDLERQLDELVTRREERVQRPASQASPIPSPAPTAGRGAASTSSRSFGLLSEVSAQVLLAACGAALLALAAIAFLAVNWTSPGPLAQAGLLVLSTVVSGAASQWARRRDLASTSEALAGLTAALAVVVFVALRRSGLVGVDRVPLEVYAAASGTGLAVGILGWARWAGTRVGQVAAVIVAVCTAFVAPVAAVSLADSALGQLGRAEAASEDAYALLLALAAAGLSLCGRALTETWARTAGRVGLIGVVVFAWFHALIIASSTGPLWALAAALLLSLWLWTRCDPPDLCAAAAAAS